MQARMMGMFGQATSEGFGRSVSVGTLMLHGGKQKIGHEKNLTMMRMIGRATHRFIQTIGGTRGMEVTTEGSGKRGTEKIGGKSRKSRKRGMTKIGG